MRGPFDLTNGPGGDNDFLFTNDKYNLFKINVNDIFIFGKDCLSKMKYGNFYPFRKDYR